jgi:hypothetical protein
VDPERLGSGRTGSRCRTQSDAAAIEHIANGRITLSDLKFKESNVVKPIFVVRARR